MSELNACAEEVPRVHLDRWLRDQNILSSDIIEAWGHDPDIGLWFEYVPDFKWCKDTFRDEMDISSTLLISDERANYKLELSLGYGLAVTSLSLAADQVTIRTPNGAVHLVTCDHAYRGDDGCTGTCLQDSGRNAMPKCERARIRRTQLLYNYPEVFITIWLDNLRRAYNRARKQGKRPVHRPNCLSDQRWERSLPWIMQLFASPVLPEPMQFIDYTKWFPRQRQERSNYTLAWSAWASKHTWQDILDVHKTGMSVAMIVDDPDLLLQFGPEGLFVDAVAGDHWMLAAREAGKPVIGLLTPKHPMPKDHGAVFNAAQIYGETAF